MIYLKSIKIQNFQTFLQNFLNNNAILSFVEIDLYTNSLVILKNLDEMTNDDLNLLFLTFDLYKLIKFNLNIADID